MNIAICDDELLIRKSLTRIFEIKSHIVKGFEDGLQYLDSENKYQSGDVNNNNIDLLILDVIMPLKTGFDVLDQMKNKIPVIMITAFAGSDDFEKDLNQYQNVIGIIKKPFESLESVYEQIMSIYSEFINLQNKINN